MAKRLTPSNLKLARLELTGMEDYIKKIQDAGKNVDEVIKVAIEESSKPIFNDIKNWAEKHELTGETLKGVDMSEVKQDGNYIFADIGINTEKSDKAWHAVFVEFGTPTQAADPGIRNAFENNKSKVKQIQKKILQEGGLPVE